MDEETVVVETPVLEPQGQIVEPAATTDNAVRLEALEADNLEIKDTLDKETKQIKQDIKDLKQDKDNQTKADEARHRIKKFNKQHEVFWK